MRTDLPQALRDLAERKDFSGVVRLEEKGEVRDEFCRGFADRANGRRNHLDTRFAVASGTKGLTALATMSLVESGDIELGTTLRSIVGDTLPLVDPAVTIDQLLTHRSGVGDYLDEELLGDIDEHILGNRSAHTFQTPADYVHLLSQPPQKSAPGVEFVYNNGGYMMLSVAIEVVTGSFEQTVVERVLTPAAMTNSGFFRSDDLPPNSAIGYLKNGRTNVFHLPVLGAGDGGIYLTLEDVSALWRNLEHVVSSERVAMMTTVVSDNGEKPSYGRGFWLGESGDHVWLEGMDAGVSFQSGMFRSSAAAYTVMSNTSEGVWPLTKLIIDSLARSRSV